MATDWGHRILSERSHLYDPLSYHYGSVWPLFTGWASVAAYRYGRPHVGYQALMANALAHGIRARSGMSRSCCRATSTRRSGVRRITRSGPKRWSCRRSCAACSAIEPLEGGARLRIAPQLPARLGSPRRATDRRRWRKLDVDIAAPARGVLRITIAGQHQPGQDSPALRRSPAHCRSMRQIDRVTLDGRAAQPL